MTAWVSSTAHMHPLCRAYFARKCASRGHPARVRTYRKSVFCTVCGWLEVSTGKGRDVREVLAADNPFPRVPDLAVAIRAMRERADRDTTGVSE